MRFGSVLIFGSIFFAASVSGAAKEINVSLPDVASALKKVEHGDVIVVTDGTYRDVTLKWDAPGFPVTVKAETPGGVVVTGLSSLRFGGDSLTVAGFDFVNAHPQKGSLIEFRLGKKLANASRLTDIYISDCNPASREQVSSYIVLHGRHNRVDHSTLTGKKNLGVTLLVNLNDAGSLENHHLIDHNYFGPRPVYGSNGAETMRIGTSQQSYETSATVVENNFFEQCNGEVEIISVKSSDNIIRGNVFYECQGVVALRHGRRNTVENNIFCGNDVRHTGGVRIVDAGHKVIGNTFYRLKGQRFFSALAVMNSVPNSLPNRYVKVSDILVAGNTFVDCSNIEFGTGRDEERTEHPEKCLFENNTIYTTEANPYIFIDKDSGIEFKGNKIKSGTIPCPDLSPIRKEAGANRLIADDSSAVVTDTITLSPGVAYVSETMKITRPTVIEGNGAVLKWKGSGGDNFITIADGATLVVKNVTFDAALQQGFAVARNGIATDSKIIRPYSLTVINCNFLNFPESSCCGIRGMKNTFAEDVVIKDCSFSDISGNGISFADETDDKGRYNAENIIIDGCDFNRMLGIPVNIYRGGSDESTAGPDVAITRCTFNDCCNRERGSVLRLIGPQKLEIKDCRFIDSGRGGYTVRLDETTWEDVTISGCSWENSGKVLSNHQVLK